MGNINNTSVEFRDVFWVIPTIRGEHKFVMRGSNGHTIERDSKGNITEYKNIQ